MREKIIERLYELEDRDYRDFQSRLIPTVDKDTMIGVRTPILRKYAKDLQKDGQGFILLESLPHRYYEENILHAILLGEEKDFAKAIGLVEEFLPYIDNWAVCDILTPKSFKKSRDKLLPYIEKWLASDREYTLRFAIKMLMDHFLDEDFRPEYPAMVAALAHEAFYVRMMAAWYFATALAKQYPEAIKYIEENRLERWTHNKTIQKAVESFRVEEKHKIYLKSLRRERKKE